MPMYRIALHSLANKRMVGLLAVIVNELSANNDKRAMATSFYGSATAAAKQ